MIGALFDERAITNMSIALKRVCRDIPIELRTREDALFVAQRILKYAAAGDTKLGDLTAVGRQAVEELLSQRHKAA